LQLRRFLTVSQSCECEIAAIVSAIVSSVPELLKSEWANKQSFLLYWGSQDGFNAADFHRKCEDHGRTLTVIQDSNGYLFGGCTPVAWARDRGSKVDPSLSTFVFTMTNPHGFAGRKFALRADQPGAVIFCWDTHGRAFGDDFYTQDRCNRTQAEGSCNYRGGFGHYSINDSGVERDGSLRNQSLNHSLLIATPDCLPITEWSEAPIGV
jgi:hypothetical protein